MGGGGGGGGGNVILLPKGDYKIHACGDNNMGPLQGLSTPDTDDSVYDIAIVYNEQFLIEACICTRTCTALRGASACMQLAVQDRCPHTGYL